MNRLGMVVVAGAALLAGGTLSLHSCEEREPLGRPSLGVRKTPSGTPVVSAPMTPVRAARVAGVFDQTFSADGRVTTDLGGLDLANAVAVGPGDTIVAAGSTRLPKGGRIAFALSRYQADGSLDSGFGGGDGLVTTEFDTADDAENEIHDVLVGTDGRITAVGSAGGAFNGGMAVARYRPDGSIDTSFGDGDGVVTIPRGDQLWGDCSVARAVAGGPDGALILAGSTGCGGESDGGVDVVVVRLNANGELDRSFGHDGFRVFNYGSCSYASAVGIQRDGKIVVAGGDGGCYEKSFPFRVARLNPDGSNDRTFGRRGRARVQFARGESGALDLALDRRENILLVGTAGNRFAIARLKPDGHPDPHFGTGGKALSAMPRSREAIPQSIVPADDGFLVAGSDYTRSGDANRGLLGIYASDGDLQHLTAFRFEGTATEVNAIVADRQGRVVAAGAAGQDFALARLR
jgi:uncharacterized delta-60 repeat protein